MRSLINGLQKSIRQRERSFSFSPSIMKYFLFFILILISTHLSAFDIQMTHDDRQKTYQIIKTMGDYNEFSLLLRKKELKKLGREVDHVPPLSFLAYICSDPNLKVAMREIRNSYFKWHHFIKGLAPKMDNGINTNEVYRDLPDFAKLLQVSYNDLHDRCRNKDWAGFVELLL